jgi:hypothetical protein
MGGDAVSLSLMLVPEVEAPRTPMLLEIVSFLFVNHPHLSNVSITHHSLLYIFVIHRHLSLYFQP